MATNNTAFEAPDRRFAWYCAEPINKYEAVIVDENGTLVPANATNTTETAAFVGVCQYGAETAGEMVTVVKGAFPVVANGPIQAGELVIATDGTTVVNDKTFHTVGPATSESLLTSNVLGTALTSSTAEGDLITILIK